LTGERKSSSDASDIYHEPAACGAILECFISLADRIERESSRIKIGPDSARLDEARSTAQDFTVMSSP
jgi:hypothetical protein